MKLNSKSLIAVLTLCSSLLAGFAANAANSVDPKPACPMGEVAKLEQGHWQCHKLGITAKPDPQAAVYMKLGDIKGESAGKSRSGVNVAAGDLNGDGRSKPAGERPKCPKGLLPKLENGMWQCVQPSITAKPEGQQGLLLPAVQKVREAASK